MSLLELGPIIFGPKRGLINFLQNKHLIARNMDCQQCGIAMNLQTRDETVCSDCYSWRCPTCYTFRSVRHRSFFSKSRLSLQKWLLLMHLWSRDCPVTDAAQEVEITEKSAIQLYQYFRDVCSWRLVHHDPQIVLGGTGQVVSIDESLFCHKVKYHRGRAPNTEVWVFGLVDISHSPALGYMEVVPRRDAATLLPILNSHIAPGTEVWSDQWSAYSGVGALSNVSRHRTVNHSQNFVDPATGVHTQHIESYWNRVKTKLKRMKGVQKTMMEGYLDEFMWKERYGTTRREAFQSLCRDIALWYPV